MTDKKRSSHLGAGILVGAAIGIATAAFFQSKKGKAFTKDLQKKTMALQKKVSMELQKTGVMTEKNYHQLVDKVIAYYVKTKDIAKNEIPEVKKILMAHWKTIERELKSVK